MSRRTIPISIKKKKPNKLCLEQLRKELGSQCACYVLITCTEPSNQGSMDVEMHFEGDESLAAFLVQNATQVFEEKMALRETQ